MPTKHLTTTLTEQVWESERYERRAKATRRRQAQRRDKRGRWVR